MKLSIQLFCVSVILTATGIAQEPEQLKELRFKFEVAIAEERKPLKEFEKQYRAQLQKLEGSMQAAGDLKKLLAAREELKRFGSGNTKGFPELERLQGIYKKEKEAIVSKSSGAEKRVIGAYQKKLSELQKRLTQEGKIDAAVKVAAAIEKLKQSGIAVTSPSIPMMKAGSSTTASATKEKPYENSLGMRFVPVPINGGPTNRQRVLFSIWETRVKDYEQFISDYRQIKWEPQPDQKSSHAAVKASWDDAVVFCKWLTEKDREKGILGENEIYRLPSDHEWSCAVGIGRTENAEDGPFSQGGKIKDKFPWGKGFPPPADSGNYNGEEARGDPALPFEPISGYNDGFVRTSPVGSFNASRLGLYDLGGNVWEWCQDWLYSDKTSHRVFRGGAYNLSSEQPLLSSARGGNPPGARLTTVGFRIVIAPVAQNP